MRRILKYEIKPHGGQIIEFNGQARILCVGVQDNKPYIWADVTEHPLYKEKKQVQVFQTGEIIAPELVHRTKYIGTFFLNNGEYVGHAHQIFGEE